MITHLEPDILEAEIKWALESIAKNKASGGDGIPVELFQLPKDDAWSAALNMPANLENSAVAIGLEKVQFSFQSQRRAMPKNVQTTSQLHSFHMLARSCSKSSKLGFNNTWTNCFQMYKLDLEKAEEPESNC